MSTTVPIASARVHSSLRIASPRGSSSILPAKDINLESHKLLFSSALIFPILPPII
jgi:hypothetical protein